MICFKIPVFSGAERAFIVAETQEGPPYHGVDGFGDLDWEAPPNLSVVRNEQAPIAMQQLVSMVFCLFYICFYGSP